MIRRREEYFIKTHHMMKVCESLCDKSNDLGFAHCQDSDQLWHPSRVGCITAQLKIVKGSPMAKWLRLLPYSAFNDMIISGLTWGICETSRLLPACVHCSGGFSQGV